MPAQQGTSPQLLHQLHLRRETATDAWHHLRHVSRSRLPRAADQARRPGEMRTHRPWVAQRHCHGHCG